MNAYNAQILNAKGERNYFVNVDKCPSLAEALEQQVYDKHGMPDKSTGHDHVVDASGYFIAKQFPIVRPIAKTTKLSMRR